MRTSNIDRLRYCAIGTLLVVLAGAALAEPPAEGDPVPNFTLSVLDAGEVTLSEKTGEGPVVLVFFRGAW